jgi:superfamily II DNA or RNA helicase
MNNTKGAIYIRDNAWYRTRNIYKMGVSSCIKDRNSSYITGEPEPGEFIFVIEIPLEKMKILDRCIKSYYKPYNIYICGGGTEFYERCIIELIEPYLQKLNVEYKVLTKEEIEVLNRRERIKNIPNAVKLTKLLNRIDTKKIIQIQKNKRTITPNEQQKTVLEMIENYYSLHDRGKLVWACGLGKALLSVLIVKRLNFKKIVFGVPSNQLQKQIKNEIVKIFPKKNNILLVGGDDDCGVISTTSKKQILSFFDIARDEPVFIITTYHSCHLLLDMEVDFKIGDEAHHLVGIETEEEKGFRLFHKIRSQKSLFMTATEKTMETQCEKERYSMDDETVFGKYINVKTVHWAIENKKITDYNMLVLKNTEDEIDEIMDKLRVNVENKEIFASCIMTIKSFEKYGDLTHLLLYTNTTNDAEIAKRYIDEILSAKISSIPKDSFYNAALHSKSCSDLDDEVCKFKNASYGIICCVYIFGEGFDLPKLNGVCIAGNMQSETRIVQYLLRPNRLEKGNPNKKAYVIIPCIDWEDWETEKKSYERVKTVVSQMRNVDENIEQKIIVSVGCGKIPKKPTENGDDKNNGDDESDEFQENSHELNKIKLRLRYSKALGSKFTEEQDEYNYVRSVNAGLKIQSKREYNECRNIHSNYIVSPEEYFTKKGVWNNWYDFLGTNTLKFIQSKQEWINFCKEKNIGSLDEYYEACEIYAVLPKEPDVFYKDFKNIPTELGFNFRRRGVIL